MSDEVRQEARQIAFCEGEFFWSRRSKARRNYGSLFIFGIGSLPRSSVGAGEEGPLESDVYDMEYLYSLFSSQQQLLEWYG